LAVLLGAQVKLVELAELPLEVLVELAELPPLEVLVELAELPPVAMESMVAQQQVVLLGVELQLVELQLVE